ncbi:hypothetical protein J0H58_34150 [bacterium]|nr:hypothetical protein [bacterium]
MRAVAPSEASIAVLRAISRSGFSYAQSKSLCDAAGWRLVDDELDLGYVRYDMILTSESNEQRPLSLLITESGTLPFAFVPLFWFDEYADGREPFDRAYDALAGQITGILGTPTKLGAYGYPHRAGRPYFFAGWVLSDATLTLVQDEFDIQFGMDVTLWVQPAGTRVEVPVQHT